MNKKILIIGLMLAGFSFSEKLNIELNVGTHNFYVLDNKTLKEFVEVKASYKNFDFSYKGIQTEETLKLELFDDDEDEVEIVPKKGFENIFSVGFNTKYFNSHLVYNKPNLYSVSKLKYGKDLILYTNISYCFNNASIIAYTGLEYTKNINNFNIFANGAIRLATKDEYRPVLVLGAGISYSYKLNDTAALKISDNVEIVENNFRNIIKIGVILSPEF